MGITFCTRVSLAGETADQASFAKEVRNEPLNTLPPDFVMTFTTPPEKRPYSALIAAVDVVVSWTASSM